MEPTAVNYDEFYGFDFDWFALDNAGVAGLFSTAGYGEIPGEVMQQAQAHRDVFERLALPSWGTQEIWQDCGRLGLFAFDWQEWKGPYLKMVAPSLAIKAELRNQILRIPNLPRLNVRFGLVPSVTIPRFGT